MTKFAKALSRNQGNFSLGRALDFIALVLIGFVASFIFFFSRTKSAGTALGLGLAFTFCLVLVIYSINQRRKLRRGGRIQKLANKLWMQRSIVSGDDTKFESLMVDLLSGDGYRYMPELGTGCRMTKKARSYLLLSLRRHPSVELSAQDIMTQCDIARNRGFFNVIVAASCEISEEAQRFAEDSSTFHVMLMDIHDIAEMAYIAGYRVPEKEKDDFTRRASKEDSRQVRARRGVLRRFPALRYLMVALMLGASSLFMPYRRWYLIMAGISLLVFLIVLIFPKKRSVKTKAS